MATQCPQFLQVPSFTGTGTLPFLCSYTPKGQTATQSPHLVHLLSSTAILVIVLYDGYCSQA